MIKQPDFLDISHGSNLALLPNWRSLRFWSLSTPGLRKSRGRSTTSPYSTIQGVRVRP